MSDLIQSEKWMAQDNSLEIQPGGLADFKTTSCGFKFAPMVVTLFGTKEQ